MIVIKIPKEIREYKEKLIFGLTARQVIAILFVAGICIPAYLFGRKYIGEDAASWLMILAAAPGVCYGWYQKNGMPFEKYFSAIAKKLFLYPHTTVFKTKNFFRTMQTKAEQEEEIGVNPKKMKKYREKATLERCFLMEEAEENKEDDFNIKDVDDFLITVKKPVNKNSSPKNDKDDKDGEKEKKTPEKKSKAQLVAEAVERKKEKNPLYVPTKTEGKMLLAYAKECEKKRLAEVRAGVKTVKVKNEKLNKRRTAKSFIPKSTQDDLPYVADFDEGVFEAEPGKYSKTYLFTDINYLTAKQEEAEAIFCKWRDFLNCFSEEITLAVTTDNCVISVKEQEKKIFRTLTGDAYDIHREEFNKILKKQMMAGNNDIQRFKYITVTISADSAYEAVLRFRREIDALVCDNLKKVGVYGTPLTTDERLSLLHDKMRKGREGEFKINYDFLKAQGLSSKDYVAPSSFFWKPKDYFMVEDTYCCCLYMNNLPSMLADDVYRDINDCPFPLLSTLSIQSMAPEKAIKLVKRQITGMETNKMDAEKKAIRAGYSPEIINHDLIHSLEEGYALLDDIQNKDQKLFFVSILFMVSGDTLDELKENTKLLISKARAATCQMQIFDNQQRDAFKVVMPFGVTPKGKVFVERVLTTESTAVFVPFTNREIFQPGGFYYGLNQISRNLVLCDRTKMKTPSGFILGSSGSGKSFACKREMLSVLLSDDKTGLLVIDPENEYGDFCRVFGGTVVSLSTSSECYINPMDMDENYGLDEEDDIDKTPMEKKKKKALQKKTEYLMSIIQYMVADDNNSTSLSPQQKTIVDRAIRKTYEKYLEQGFDKKYLPTLLDLQEELDEEKKLSEDGRLIAEACAYYTRGSMDLFSHKTNLDLSNRFMVFNIRDLGKELKQISLLIVLDFIWDRMSVNCHKNIRTYCYVDEIHVLVQNPLSERYLQQLYKRGRKYGLVISGITQDVQDLLRSDIAQGMLTNSDFILMLNQKGENLEALSKLLRISEAEAGYVSMAEPGCGLLFAEKTIVPFVDKFPEDSYLYALMSTKFGENNDIDVDAFIEKLQKEQAERELTKKNKVSA